MRHNELGSVAGRAKSHIYNDIRGNTCIESVVVNNCDGELNKKPQVHLFLLKVINKPRIQGLKTIVTK